MLSKSIIALATLAVAQVALAQPYCLLAAVNKFEHPADQKTLCCKEASKVKSYLSQLCPSSMESAAVKSFESACKDAGYGSCSSSSSSVSSSATGSESSKTGSASSKAYATSAPYPVVYTTTYYDEECTCTKTTAVSSSVLAGSTGFATGTAPVATGTSGAGSPGSGSGAGSPGSGSGAGAPGSGSGAGAPGSGPGGSSPSATGSPITPVVAPTAPGSATGPSSSSFTGAATKNVGSVAVGLLAVAGVAWAL